MPVPHVLSDALQWILAGIVFVGVVAARGQTVEVFDSTSRAKVPPGIASKSGVKNIFGAHLLVSDAKPNTRGLRHLRWARYLVGKNGYAKTFFSGITKETTEPLSGWIDFVDACYQLELIPVVRLGGTLGRRGWDAPIPDAPGDYHSMAAAIKAVVNDLPRSDRYPLYIEIWNEPNLPHEWSGRPNPQEYADFFVQAAEAVRSIGDSRIRILNGALAPGDDWVEALCRANPRFVSSFDVWASHPYGDNHPPSFNHHDKTAPADAAQTIDAYVPELEVLRRHGRDNVRVMITETGYALGTCRFAREGYPCINEDNRADYMVRAYRDYWSKWPELIAVIPFQLCHESWGRFDWVYPDSETAEDGRPLHVHKQYAAVAGLAKPGEPTGVISGRVTVDKLGLPVEGAYVELQPQPYGASCDVLGNFILPKLAPDKYRVLIRKAGFDSVERKVVVTAGTNTVLDVALTTKQTGSLSGVVCNSEDGKPLGRVKIELRPGKSSTFTDDKGGYKFEACVPGRYTLVTQANRMESYEATVNVAVNKNTRHDFVLGRSKSPQAENMLTNAGFEDGGGGGGKPDVGLGFEMLAPREYREGMQQVSQRLAHTGRCSQEIRISPRENVIRQITDYNSVPADSSWLAGAWVRVETSDDNAAAWISITANQNDGTKIGGATSRYRVGSGSKGWVWLQTQFKVPPGSERVSINLHAQGQSGSAYFDDLWLGIPAGQ